jgi:hypothetical protein
MQTPSRILAWVAGWRNSGCLHEQSFVAGCPDGGLYGIPFRTGVEGFEEFDVYVLGDVAYTEYHQMSICGPEERAIRLLLFYNKGFVALGHAGLNLRQLKSSFPHAASWPSSWLCELCEAFQQLWELYRLGSSRVCAYICAGGSVYMYVYTDGSVRRHGTGARTIVRIVLALE